MSIISGLCRAQACVLLLCVFFSISSSSALAQVGLRSSVATAVDLATEYGDTSILYESFSEAEIACKRQEAAYFQCSDERDARIQAATDRIFDLIDSNFHILLLIFNAQGEIDVELEPDDAPESSTENSNSCGYLSIEAARTAWIDCIVSQYK